MRVTYGPGGLVGSFQAGPLEPIPLSARLLPGEADQPWEEHPWRAGRLSL